MEFSMMGDDEDNLLPRAIDAVKPFLHPDTQFSQSKGVYGDRMVIESFIPLGTKEALDAYASEKSLSLGLLAKKWESEWISINLTSTDVVEQIDQQLRGLNLMLGFETSSKNTTFRVINDLRDKIDVNATAVFVSKKPYKYYNKNISRRESVEIVFKGGDESIYSELEPSIGMLLSKN